MSYLSIMGLLGLFGSVVTGIGYVVLYVIALIFAGILFLKDKVNAVKCARMLSGEVAEKQSKLEGRLLGYPSGYGTCCRDDSKLVEARIVRVDFDTAEFIMDNGRRLYWTCPFNILD